MQAATMVTTFSARPTGVRKTKVSRTQGERLLIICDSDYFLNAFVNNTLARIL